jgi:L-2-hydroxyglutarate oxidase LhgO
LVNAAGLHAPEVAAAIEGLPPTLVPRQHLLKGSYFTLRVPAGTPAPFSHLVYPVPDAATLGIHVTLDLAGRVRLGPDQAWVDRIDYAVDPARAPAFAHAVADYYPDLDPTALEPDTAGIRPKLHGPGQPLADFVVQGPEGHGIPGLCNLFGIESPGLTSCLAIAHEVLERLGIPPAPE